MDADLIISSMSEYLGDDEEEETYDTNYDDLSSELGYLNEQIIVSHDLALINIFSMGILAGLIMGLTLWRK